MMAKLPQHQKPSSILSSANAPKRNVAQTAVSVEKLRLTALISVVVQTVGNHVKTCMKAMMVIMTIMMIMMMMMMMKKKKKKKNKKKTRSQEGSASQDIIREEQHS